MKYTKAFVAFISILFSFALTACLISAPPATKPVTTSSVQITTQTVPQNLSDSLIVEPSSGITPVLSKIQGAVKSIDLVMYELEDTQVENALIAAEKRGIVVRVLLNEGYYGAQPSASSAATYQYLQSAEVSVHWAPAYFALTHQKTLVVDGNQAIIMTFNLTPQYYTADRDFGVVDNDIKDVTAIETAFNDDWQGVKDTAAAGDDLVWSPGAETTILSIINNSRQSLFIENEEMSDTAVVNALIAAAQRGVMVELVMTYSNEWTANFTKLAAAGVGIRTYATDAHLYIHAKLILCDGTSVLVGSQNFSASSLKDNRELGIIISDSNLFDSLFTTFRSDWLGGTPF
jgi:cardiolipin synthase A/B